jgi:hypothetical protein
VPLPDEEIVLYWSFRVSCLDTHFVK